MLVNDDVAIKSMIMLNVYCKTHTCKGCIFYHCQCILNEDPKYYDLEIVRNRQKSFKIVRNRLINDSEPFK